MLRTLRRNGQEHIDALPSLSMITDKENIVLNYLDRNSVDIDDLHKNNKFVRQDSYCFGSSTNGTILSYKIWVIFRKSKRRSN